MVAGFRRRLGLRPLSGCLLNCVRSMAQGLPQRLVDGIRKSNGRGERCTSADSHDAWPMRFSLVTAEDFPDESQVDIAWGIVRGKNAERFFFGFRGKTGSA